MIAPDAIVHAFPSHCSMSGVAYCECSSSVPMAVQLDGLAHETPVMLTEEVVGVVGLGVIDQLVPFQCSISGELVAPAYRTPIKVQSVVLGHDTALSA